MGTTRISKLHTTLKKTNVKHIKMTRQELRQKRENISNILKL